MHNEIRTLRRPRHGAPRGSDDTAAFIDEIPAAYKDIDQVMLDATDLVEVHHTLRQIVNVKGD